MNKYNIFESRRPLIAILRGITPLEAESVSDVLIEAGISIIEVPLNSPQPFETIERMVKFHGNNGIFGAGTVLREYDVYRVQEVGGKIIVSPNLNTLVIKKTKEFNKFLEKNKLANALIITDTDSMKNIDKSARNIKNIKLIKDEGTNIYDLFKYKNVIITSSSAKKIQERILNEKN